MNTRRFPALPAPAALLLAALLLAAGLTLGAVPAFAAGGDMSVLDAWTQAARWIVSPWATIALLFLGCLLLFIDLLTLDTWGWTGTLGVISVGSVFAAHVVVGTGGWIGIVVTLLGLALLLVETHVVPGQGMAGFGGMLLLFLGMFWTLGGSGNAAFALPVSTILTIVAILGFFAYLPKSPVWKKLDQEMRQRGRAASQDPARFLGRTGTAATALRPFGVAAFDGVRLDVVTEGEFLSVGTLVRVVRVENGRVVVDDEATQAEPTAA